MELSRRLQAVAAMVPIGTIAADIGCDHGYVSIYLIKNSICPKVIAMDVNQGPLARAAYNIKQENLEAFIDTRLSDGLTKINDKEVDTVICAGMGGRLMERILIGGIKKIGKIPFLVLQPQSELFVVRQFLRKSGYEIIDENIIFEDGKYYPMMLAKVNEDNEITEEIDAEGTIEDYYGPILLKKKHPILKEYLLFEQEVVTRNLEKLLTCAALPQAEKEAALSQKLKRIAACLLMF